MMMMMMGAMMIIINTFLPAISLTFWRAQYVSTTSWQKDEKKIAAISE